MVVRPATVDDAQAVQRLFEGHLNWINVTYPTDYVVPRRYSSNFFGELFPANPAMVVDDGHRLVGFTATRMKVPHLLEVVNCYVDDPYRGRGLGEALLKATEAGAKNDQYRVIIAMVSEHWHPNKPSVRGLFARLDYDVVELDEGTDLYKKHIG